MAATPEEDRDALAERLHWLGFHAELRSGVRDPGFRSLPTKLQETISGKTFEMLTKTYDEVTVSDMRDQEMQLASRRQAESGPIASTNCEQEGYRRVS